MSLNSTSPGSCGDPTMHDLICRLTDPPTKVDPEHAGRAASCDGPPQLSAAHMLPQRQLATAYDVL